MTKKPPYKIPSMQEIETIPWNGFTVASTFSGCGGSCLGYRLAGFRVLWANEFVPIAQESYERNKNKECFLDKRPIQEVRAEDILAQTGLEVGELDLFDGSPPCQAFSGAGRRQAGWGKLREYDHGAKQKNEDLFVEYIRLLSGLRPKCFVAENVPGMARGKAKGFFVETISALRSCGYSVEAKILNAAWFGVPQARRRLFFVGVRSDIGALPVFPSPLPYSYSVSDACHSIPASVYSDKYKMDVSSTMIYGNNEFSPHGQTRNKTTEPILTIIAGASGRTGIWVEVLGRARELSIDEVKKLCSYPDDFVLSGNRKQQWARLGNSVPPMLMMHVSAALRDGVLARARARAQAHAVKS